MTIYFHRKSGATSEMTKKDFDNLPDYIRKKYRIATETEVEAHNVKKSKQKFKKHQDEKSAAKKSNQSGGKNANDDKKSDDKKGTEDKAESSSSK